MAVIPPPSSSYSTSVSSGTTSPSLSGDSASSTSQPSAVSGSGQPPTSTLYSASSPPFAHNTSYSNKFYVFGTLLILIGICVAVILRGTILHRQWQRYVEAAIAAGEIPPGDYREGDEIALARARKKKQNRVGPKPDMHHVFLEEGEKWWSDEKVERWGKPKPFSAMLLPTASSRATCSPAQNPPRLRGWLVNALRDFRAPDATSPSLPHIASHAHPTDNSLPSPPYPPTPRTIQASFLISMPSPSRNRKFASVADDASASVEDGSELDGSFKSEEAQDISPVSIASAFVADINGTPEMTGAMRKIVTT
ncbi:hypothetical protein BD410DRAFT_894024 [Rickenella mellea]|uniref:Uncharacterized protein n=1 Tax=Rickenella mellea TaxID=50990 RepID=A0A4Y7QL95_9AGAM|nr:hypothetical protein BD410DRAFT_894024 [Rickenella mellea]